MIDVAVIAPIAHLDLATHGTIDMALAHLVLAHPRYAAHYAARAEQGVRVILDNSAFELESRTGRGLGVEPVLDAAHRVAATDIVCTDVLYDAAGTRAATGEFLLRARDATRARLMAVPQGKTRDEWLSCYEALVAMEGVDTIGVSKLTALRCWGVGVGGSVAAARIACVAELHRSPPPKPLHLLGGDRSLPAELARHRALGHHAVRGNDSSAAVWYAAHDHGFDGANGRAGHPVESKPDLEHAVLTPEQHTLARANIAVLRCHAGVSATDRAPRRML